MATMHSPRIRSASISSPISVSFPSSHSAPSAAPAAAARPSHKAHRPSLSNTMSRLKDQLREKIQENVASVSERAHGAAYGHRRGISNTRNRRSDGDDELRDIVISDPQLTSSTDSLPTRLAPLGSGAIVVGTPQEALELAGQKTAGYRPNQASASTPARINQYRPPQPSLPEEDESDLLALPALPTSRPSSPRNVHRELPPSRLSHDSDFSGTTHSSQGLAPEPRISHGSNGRRGSPLVPIEHRYSNKSAPDMVRYPQEVSEEVEFSIVPPEAPRRKAQSHRSPSNSRSSHCDEKDNFAAAPQLPVDLATALPQPNFEPVLVSHLPSNMHKIDPAKLIVKVETSSSTYKSTLKTLTARPSHLATYLNDLVASTTAGPSRPRTPQPARDDASMYSRLSEYEESDDENAMGFNSLFREHLASTGVIKPTQPARRADATSMIHIFLDRPSAPYEYIASYLRAPITESSPRGTLPYGARLFPASRHSFATDRLETLLELRDEALYLGLDDLQQLCDDELAGQVPLAAEMTAKRESDSKSEHSTHTLIDGTGFDAKMNTSPPLQTVDIPIVLPAHHEPRSTPVRVGAGTKTHSTESSTSVGSQVSTASRRDRRVGHVDAPPKAGFANATQLREQSLERQRALARPPGNYF